ncbi:MAG: hypothetical protein H8D22_01925 [Candidatus Cloacimonetes bacterium]|nr:hypothetical protein [Candidatus Cloacimonadota bacterium]
MRHDILKKSTFAYYIYQALKRNNINFLEEIVTFTKNELDLSLLNDPNYILLWLDKTYNKFIDAVENIDKEKEFKRFHSKECEKIVKKIILLAGDNGILLYDLMRKLKKEGNIVSLNAFRFCREYQKFVKSDLIPEVYYKSKKFYWREKEYSI